ncbi:FGGY family carbohydrate kinase [Pseudonocardia eucalypti]|uniref:FGGY family carbohydrate kinase n=1 Tax=Pseudonocardia eucalypti TaxID=648755 RepID=A0ABP9Q9J7_9PSEU|nr:xylulokinase [Pseudonocardia eucalypti]
MLSPAPTALVVDAGTTAVKAAVVAGDGRVLGGGSAGLTTAHPGPGRVEQHPDDWWRGFVGAVRQAVSAVSAGGSVDALCVTGQMQDCVPLDADGEPVRPALLYADQRAVAELGALDARFGADWHRAAGNVGDAASTAAQLLWLRRHEPETPRRARRLLLGAPGYLLHRAGGRAAVDLTTASTTGLLDIRARDWWSPMLHELSLDPDTLPELVAPGSPVGVLAPGPAGELGLPAGLPLIHAAGDAGAVTDGLVGAEPGATNISLGTSGWVAALTSRPGEPDPALHQLIGADGRSTLLIGALLSAGATVDWARRTYLPGADHAAADRAAADAGPTGLLMLPSLVGERSPVRDPDATGAVVGLRATTTAAQLYRAAMEGVAYSLRHVLALLAPRLPARNGPIPLSGGAARSPVFQQIIADVLDCPVCPVPDAHAAEAGLRGAHRAAASALGEPVPPPLAGAAHSGAGLSAAGLSDAGLSDAGLADARPTGAGQVTVCAPGPAREHYARLADAHAGLWTALAPTFRSQRP